MNFLFRYANPANFMRPLGCGAALYRHRHDPLHRRRALSGFSAPPDYQQGPPRCLIMFIHVRAATVAMSVYGAIAVCSLLSLVWRHPLSDIAAARQRPLAPCSPRWA